MTDYEVNMQQWVCKLSFNGEIDSVSGKLEDNYIPDLSSLTS